ncbi:methyl-accepting chemotaxis protein [Chromobacterium aquaticum]|uniref:methyl-accepting chemotaxis protein n=1 Tax=Chromobacterium aquaticum TaxID=467180 RepID=UPI001E2EAB31|nr:methyl-accepting chemotaxis protein [Chromobacterium aquaticum]MCD5363628.1 methyl-accepting chemotaxis protein [Chromobacterium aquaticum]
MSQSKNGMTIAQKLGLGFGLIIVLMLICVSCALYGLEVSNSALRNITTFNNQESRQARLLVSDNQDIRIAYRNVMLAEGPTDISASLQAYQATKQAYMEREKKLADIFRQADNNTPQELELLGRIQNMRPATLALVDKAVDLANQGRQEDAKKIMQNDIAPQMQAFNQQLNALADLEDKLNDQLAADANGSYQQAHWVMIGLSLFAVVISAGLATLITRNLLRTLGGEPHYVSEVMRQVADGKLDTEIRLRPGDQTSLCAAIAATIERLRTIIAEVKSGSEALSSAAQQINSTSQSLSQAASEQAAGIEETSASVEEMSSSISQTNDNARVTESIATKASREAAEGGEAVRRTVDAMRQIADKIGIVDDIAYQTNLLALNGKGFAVVAAEVRKLAERSQIAAQEISGVAGSSVKLAEQAGQFLEEIVRSSSRTADLVQEIAAASNEQASGVSQINSAIQQLSLTTQQNASASEELASTAEEMNDQAEHLHELMGYFKLSANEDFRPAPRQRTRHESSHFPAPLHAPLAEESDFIRF